jgi:hypothetical protein
MDDNLQAEWEHIAAENNLTEGQVPEVLVVIPTLHGRKDLLKQAMRSIRGEEVSFAVVVQADNRGRGPAATRNSAVSLGIETYGYVPWIAFLDDDDEFKPGHLTKCVRHAQEAGADVVYPWFDLIREGVNRNDWEFLRVNGKPAFGQPFNPAALDAGNYIPVTALVRTSLFNAVGGFPSPGTPEWPHSECEDWGLWRRLRDEGAVFSHLPERTWVWMHHGKNTSGRVDNAARIYGAHQ